MRIFFLAALLLAAAAAHAQLVVSVSPVKVTGSKALVKLKLNNTFADKVESARAVCFLTDEQGKVVGQRTEWVIGGTWERPGLEPGEIRQSLQQVIQQNLNTYPGLFGRNAPTLNLPAP